MDQFTKQLVERLLPGDDEHIVIRGFFKFVHWSNTGAAWSLFMGNNNKTFTSTGMGVGNRVPAGGIERAMNIGQNADMVTARINYRFGGPIVPLY